MQQYTFDQKLKDSQNPYFLQQMQQQKQGKRQQPATAIG